MEEGRNANGNTFATHETPWSVAACCYPSTGSLIPIPEKIAEGHAPESAIDTGNTSPPHSQCRKQACSVKA